MKTNFHSHTYLCGHATGHPTDYIKKAIELGFTSYGISDHAFLPESKVKRRTEYPWLSYQMSKEQFDNIYLNMLDEAISLYKDKINIYKGLEVEYNYNEEEYYNYLLDKLDYLILGVHFMEDEFRKIEGTRGIRGKQMLDLYAKTMIDGIKSGYFTIIAHPDIFMYSGIEFDSYVEKISRDIIETAIKYNVCLEVNCCGIQKGIREANYPYHFYPKYEFWKLVSEYKDAKVVIGFDSHNVSELENGNYEIALDLLKKLGIPLYHVNERDFK